MKGTNLKFDTERDLRVGLGFDIFANILGFRIFQFWVVLGNLPACWVQVEFREWGPKGESLKASARM